MVVINIAFIGEIKMSLYVKITRPGFNEQGYIVPTAIVKDAAEAELDYIEDCAIGDKLQFEVIEMSDEEYEKSEEFMGW
jgi:hypothetical protein